MIAMPSGLRLLLLATLTSQTLGSRISFFTDSECEHFTYDAQGPNGYPDGDCSLLNTKGDFASFKVARLDRGCDVTLYGPNTTQGICSPGGSIVANVGRCYNNSTWTYYSIDTCIRQEESSSSSSSASTSQTTLSSSSTSNKPSSSPTASASRTPSSTPEPASSSSNTGAIAGGVIAGVAGLAIIIGGIWFVLRRRRRQASAGAEEMPPVEVSGEPMVEMSGKEIPKPSELPEARAEAYVEPPPQELSAEGEKGIGVARGEKPPI